MSLLLCEEVMVKRLRGVVGGCRFYAVERLQGSVLLPNVDEGESPSSWFEQEVFETSPGSDRADLENACPRVFKEEILRSPTC